MLFKLPGEQPGKPHQPGAAFPAFPRISLIGFMGSGKSTVGPLLAQALGYRFLDLDLLIERRAGKPIRDIFNQEGEAAFRNLETETLYSLSGKKGLVIASGGGAAVQSANSRFFRSCSFTIYLEISYLEFKRRTGKDPNRPLLQQPESDLKRLFAERLSAYRALGIGVLTDGRSPGEVVQAIFSLLEKQGPDTPG